MVTIRPLCSDDRPALAAMLETSGFFTPEEVTVALELVDLALKTPDQKDYTFGIADVDGHVGGYLCFGEVPMTLGTFDIYWICVDPHRKNQGIGRRLMAWAEEAIRRLAGRLAILETSGRALYEPTRAFYHRIGYIEAARIKDFYRPGDDKVILTKNLEAN
jgi:ribosomal protein S18 acetylase RimI-like enzyme